MDMILLVIMGSNNYPWSDNLMGQKLVRSGAATKKGKSKKTKVKEWFTSGLTTPLLP